MPPQVIAAIQASILSAATIGFIVAAASYIRLCLEDMIDSNESLVTLLEKRLDRDKKSRQVKEGKDTHNM